MIGAVLTPIPAHASAWRPPEEGQRISTFVGGVSDTTQFFESEIYFEVPVSERLSAVVTPRIESGAVLPTDGSSELVQTTRGELSTAAKFNLHQGPNIALSVQSGLVWNSSSDGSCGDTAGEIRALAGVSKGAVFADAQLAYRARSGDCPNGKADFTAGWRPLERWMGLGQVFFDAAPSRSPVVKLQMSLVRFNQEGAGLQVGFRVRADHGGEGERAIVVSWWRAPHKSVTAYE